jgi:hypothetical protein
VMPYLSDQGQRTGTHGACSRCDSYMKGFQPSRRGAASDCVEIMECGCQEAADRVTGPPQRSPQPPHIARPSHRRPQPARCRPGPGCPAC